jgi:hypothetical protein
MTLPRNSCPHEILHITTGGEDLQILLKSAAVECLVFPSSVMETSSHRVVIAGAVTRHVPLGLFPFAGLLCRFPPTNRRRNVFGIDVRQNSEPLLLQTIDDIDERWRRGFGDLVQSGFRRTVKWE